MSDCDAALLVVDDIEDNRFALSRRLARQGYLNVTTAADGREALELLNSKPFDLVLLDESLLGFTFEDGLVLQAIIAGDAAH